MLQVMDSCQYWNHFRGHFADLAAFDFRRSVSLGCHIGIWLPDGELKLDTVETAQTACLTALGRWSP